MEREKVGHGEGADTHPLLCDVGFTNWTSTESTEERRKNIRVLKKVRNDYSEKK